ncbi:MAG: sulfur oxidation c-type cytochrome SoxA [Burkholderiaceae bacterium]|nr:sulfur oxidation c-type cytochrome SoxA [Burkholderiaceae bacterium]MDP4678705.1 sulfur oxidation c-type cytochrome SoxA [Burkholderiaceae bacterium]MDP4741524.1 sulfur oxidation c-type cytochrome SoxA [Burkholderiaceae bacterium]MDP4919680.1 sulfur oxidation c-type cytochrome SoxA [Burkholderiaceae bacterium]MDP5127119.1 sulfur oxidation c-type cytochrome SoxA [Burkholderiaceae bacterium]
MHSAHALETKTETEKGIDRYRELIADGNPADLYEMEGEEIWKKPAGPKNASLEKCDLGLGPGVVKGAYVSLPRYFSDAGKVMDLEMRLGHCMKTVQGIDVKDTKYNKDDHKKIIALATYVAAQSKGMPVAVPQGHAEEKRLYEVGKRVFFYRAGPYDFACATCHAADNTRIRLQGLPNLTANEPAGKAFTSWPAYRVGNGQLWPMQKRLNDCYRQQRFPEPVYGSEATVALSVYMGVNGKGVASLAPTIKR